MSTTIFMITVSSKNFSITAALLFCQLFILTEAITCIFSPMIQIGVSSQRIFFIKKEFCTSLQESRENSSFHSAKGTKNYNPYSGMHVPTWSDLN